MLLCVVWEEPLTMNCSPLYTSHRNITTHLTTPWKVFWWSCVQKESHLVFHACDQCIFGFMLLLTFSHALTLTLTPSNLHTAPYPRFLTQNMQERQTQVLALPARAEGRDRDTEGILRKNKSATQGRNPRYSQKFLPVPCRLWRHRSMPEGVEGNAALVFSLWWP